MSHTLCLNRRASFNYQWSQTLVTGIVLQGTEVKSLRQGGGKIVDAFGVFQDDELFLQNMSIALYPHAKDQHAPQALRKLLLKKKELRRLKGLLQQKGMTLIPLSLFSGDRGWIKLNCALAQGKKDYEKRDALKQRDWQRQKEKVFRRGS